MPAAPVNDNRYLIGRRHQRARPRREPAYRQMRRIVHAVDFLDAPAVHHAVVDHSLAAAAVLLRRLEDHDGCTVEIACLTEILGGPEQQRRVPVVATRVHLALDLRGVRQSGDLVERQRVHVGTHADDLAGGLPFAFDRRHDARLPDARGHGIAAECPELLRHRRRRAMHVKAKLRVLMQVPPPCGDFFLHSSDTIDDGHRKPFRSLPVSDRPHGDAHRCTGGRGMEEVPQRR